MFKIKEGVGSIWCALLISRRGEQRPEETMLAQDHGGGGGGCVPALKRTLEPGAREVKFPS